jgi:hypothetical protein
VHAFVHYAQLHPAILSAVERVTGKVVAEGGELQDEEQFLWERQQQLERDLNELKRRQEAVRLEKWERQLQVI